MQRAGTRKKIVFALVVTTFFFLALELLLALAGVSPLIDQPDPLVGLAESLPLFVEDKDDPAELATATNKLAYFNPQSFPAIKETGTRRVFCLGGSTTFGRLTMTAPRLPGWLREFLPLADPGTSLGCDQCGGGQLRQLPGFAAVSEANCWTWSRTW